MEEEVQVDSGIEDASVQESNVTSRSDNGEYPEIEETMGIKDSSEQKHHNISQMDDGGCSIEDGTYQMSRRSLVCSALVILTLDS